MNLAWGTKVSQAFRDRIRTIAQSLELPAEGASWLMSCIAWESGRTFSPKIINKAGSGAVGLIQFMPATAGSLGTSVQELVAMTAEDQLEYVNKYFEPFKGRLKLLSDTYMVILWPKAVGQADDFVLWDAGARPITYKENAGLDGNHDSKITKGEAASRVQALYVEGLRPGNVSV